jgi:hypothetical protein
LWMRPAWILMFSADAGWENLGEDNEFMTWF